MDSFDLARLTDVDFEVLCQDLFGSKLGVRLEKFGPGPDAGVDLRYESAPGSAEIVIQCKHRMASSSSDLIRHMEKSELVKIRALRPKRYILATTVRLSKMAKDKLAVLLHPYAHGPGDIYGLDEIVAELRNDPALVERNFRLWLSGTNVLRSLLNRDALQRSSRLIEDAVESARTYAINDSLTRALSILNDRHVCLISGIPGIGKTTLALMLVTIHLQAGFSVFEISRDVDEIDAVWDDDEHQLFYYDDFLGQTTLREPLSKNEDVRLLKMLHRVRRSENKRFVLTTREYLLEQARLTYARLHQEDFSPWQCVLSVDSYPLEVQESILHNHLYFSGLAASDRHAFRQGKAYHRIVGHRNFNPRMVQQSLAVSASQDEDGSVAAHRMIRALSHPETLWEHIIHNQVDPTCAHILSVLLVLEQPVVQIELENAVQVFVEALGEHWDYQAFRKSLKVLQGTMVRPVPPEHTPYSALIEFHNPSIRDYMRSFVKEDYRIVRALLLSARHFEQVQAIYHLQDTRYVTPRPDFLTAHVEELAAACIRTFERPATTFSRLLDDLLEEEELVIRAVQALQMAHYYELEQAANAVADRVLRLGLLDLSDWELSSVESLCDYISIGLMFHYADMDVPKVHTSVDKLRKQLDDWLYDSSTHWYGAHHAQQLIDTYDLYGHVRKRTRKRIKRTLKATVEQWIAQMLGPGEPAGVDAEWEDIVDYVERNPKRVRRFEGYSAAKQRARELGLIENEDVTATADDSVRTDHGARYSTASSNSGTSDDRGPAPDSR
ncbi:restriction endonuclease [Nonomuraea sp. NPDC050202]|uniref:nSTAND3 domain-containing NTPase n=1 Tax=Nonomuraea sp. NPDC050202 TaxID=3155035 RepID=UPI0033D0F428